MNEKEDIYVMKMVINFYEEFVNSVTRQNETPHLDHPTRAAKFWGCSRWPRWRSSWTTSDGRPGRWGGVTMGVRKGPHLVD